MVSVEKNTSDTTQWIATPLYTNNDTWADSVFYVPVGSGAAGFYKEAVTDDVTESNIISTGFKLYGSTAMVNIDSTLETQWYAVNTTTDGLWYVSLSRKSVTSSRADGFWTQVRGLECDGRRRHGCAAHQLAEGDRWQRQLSQVLGIPRPEGENVGTAWNNWRARERPLASGQDFCHRTTSCHEEFLHS